VLQARIYTNSLKAFRIKPFNLNLQYQHGQPIPWVENRHYGKQYGASAWLDNIETTDQNKYVNARGAELYVQWEFKKRWWLVGGGNWLKPYDDDPEAGHFEKAYWVLRLRYTLDSFNRMLYAEYRIDYGTLYDGTPRKNELTLGFR
jgi:hypothetical protein